MVDFSEGFQLKMDHAKSEREKMKEEFQFRATEKTIAMHLNDIAEALQKECGEKPYQNKLKPEVEKKINEIYQSDDSLLLRDSV